MTQGEGQPEGAGEGEGNVATGRADGRRSFVAVALPVPLRAALFTAAATLGQQLPGVKWVPKVENLHLTLKFLGRVQDRQLATLAATLSAELAAVPPFEVSVKGIGAFPRRSHANVLWAGIDDASGGLERIAAVVEAVAGRLSIGEREARPYRAHVTLGRAKPDRDVRAQLEGWAAHLFGTFTVTEAHLYESQLSPRGSTHLVRATLKLGGV